MEHKVTNSITNQLTINKDNKENLSLFDKIKQLKILLILFLYLIFLSYIFTNTPNNTFMLNLMGLFFVFFSFFKIINIKEFKESFQNYDPITKYIPVYGYIYPFLELLLGSMFLLNSNLKIAAFSTIIILSLTTSGIIYKLSKGEIFECACLGAVFKIPLSKVTVFENCLMIVMSIYLLL
ncbi:MAG: heavy metal transporter [Nanoarchaeales archaeon]|nr:heavy metal transporter [Nanoarchaeales archaeon]